MTVDDLKLQTWYIDSNSWNRLWFYGMNKDEWIIYDPEGSGTLFKEKWINDDGFDEYPPKVASNQIELYRSILKEIFKQNIEVTL